MDYYYYYFIFFHWCLFIRSMFFMGRIICLYDSTFFCLTMTDGWKNEMSSDWFGYQCARHLKHCGHSCCSEICRVQVTLKYFYSCPSSIQWLPWYNVIYWYTYRRSWRCCQLVLARFLILTGVYLEGGCFFLSLCLYSLTPRPLTMTSHRGGLSNDLFFF